MGLDGTAFVCVAEPPSWALIIQGKLIEPQAPSLAGQLNAPPVYQPPSHPFTHYIRRLTAKLDPEQYGDGEEQVVWHKSQHTRNHRDSFEIRSRHLSVKSDPWCIVKCSGRHQLTNTLHLSRRAYSYTHFNVRSNKVAVQCLRAPLVI